MKFSELRNIANNPNRSINLFFKRVMVKLSSKNKLVPPITFVPNVPKFRRPDGSAII